MEKSILKVCAGAHLIHFLFTGSLTYDTALKECMATIIWPNCALSFGFQIVLPSILEFIKEMLKTESWSIWSAIWPTGTIHHRFHWYSRKLHYSSLYKEISFLYPHNLSLEGICKKAAQIFWPCKWQRETQFWMYRISSCIYSFILMQNTEFCYLHLFYIWVVIDTGCKDAISPPLLSRNCKLQYAMQTRVLFFKCGDLQLMQYSLLKVDPLRITGYTSYMLFYSFL